MESDGTHGGESAQVRRGCAGTRPECRGRSKPTAFVQPRASPRRSVKAGRSGYGTSASVMGSGTLKWIDRLLREKSSLRLLVEVRLRAERESHAECRDGTCAARSAGS